MTPHFSSLRCVVQSVVEVVSVDDFKRHARIDHATEDPLLASYVTAARQYAEEVRGRAYCQQLWQLSLNSFTQSLRLLPCPVQQVLSISYLNDQGTRTTVDPTTYATDLTSEPATVFAASGYCWPYFEWPSGRWQHGSVFVTFLAGYLSPVTASATTNVITATTRTFSNGSQVQVSTLYGTLPDPLKPGVLYWIVETAGSAFKLSLTEGGGAIDLTTDGDGDWFIGALPESERNLVRLLASHSYEQREPVTTGGNVSTIPLTVESLIWRDRVYY